MAQKTKDKHRKNGSAAQQPGKGRPLKSTNNRPAEIDSLLHVRTDRGESLFWIVEFQSPLLRGVHRILSKKSANGTIDSVAYMADLTPDGTAASKRNVMKRDSATREKFIADICLLQDLYELSGGTSEVRSYDGMPIEKVEALMKATDTGEVWNP